jgi:hypothetical protein
VISISKTKITFGSKRVIYIGDCTKYTGKAIKEGSHITWHGKAIGKLVHAHIINGS